MNTKFLVCGFFLVVACVLIYGAVVDEVIIDRSVDTIQGIIQGFTETEEDFSSRLNPLRSPTAVFVYYFSQIGMLCGVIMIAIGILTGKDEIDVLRIREIFSSHENPQQEKESLRHKIGMNAESDEISSTTGSHEPVIKHKENEMSQKDAEKMFIEGKISWEQYKKLKDLF